MPQITFKTTAQYQLPIIDICEKTKLPIEGAIDESKIIENESALTVADQKNETQEALPHQTESGVLSLKEEKTVQVDVQDVGVYQKTPVSPNKTLPLAQEVNIVATDHFIPRAVVCFSSDSTQNMQAIGLTFAQEAKDFQLKKQKKEKAFAPRQTIKIQSTQTAKNIPIITRSISGSRFVYDTVSLFNYCVNWCKNVYFGRVVLRAIHNTGTLLLIFPGKAAHYIQFVYKSNPLSEIQRQFQSEIMPADVKVFRSFTDFASWMKSQVPCDA